MSKKPDFTQKLLDDLRQRKQRLAAAQTSYDAREKLRRPYQGTRHTNIHKTNTNTPNHGHHKSLIIEEASKEMVPIQAARSSEYITNLSMALAFALGNGGQLGKIDFLNNLMGQKKSSLHPAQRQSLDLAQTNRRYISDRYQLVTSGSPTISQLHIREISKGAQKLNQILNACSNGLNFNRYSIEIGKELLKGAVDLEESLRMLVNLQEASQYTVGHQRKQRIQLLEEEDDDDEAAVEMTNQQSFPEKPRFSFDGSSRNWIENGRRVTNTSPIKHKLLNLTNAPNSKSNLPEPDKHTLIILNSVQHRQAASFDPVSEVISTLSSGKRYFSTDKSSNPSNLIAPMATGSSSTPIHGNKIKQLNSQGPDAEKERIPNIIAKLMGLEEIPSKTDLKNKGVEKDLKRNRHEKSSDCRPGTKTDENSEPKAPRHMKAVDSTRRNPEKLVCKISQQVELQANKMSMKHDTPSRTAVNEGKRNHGLGNMENINPIPMNSERIASKINATCLDQIKEAQVAKDDAKGREDNPKPKEHKSTEKGEQKLRGTQMPLHILNLQEHVEYPGAADAETTGVMKRTLQTAQKSGISTLGNQQEYIHDNEHKQPSVIQKSESKNKSGEQNAKTKLQVKDARKTDMMLKNPLKPMYEVNPQKKMLQRNPNTIASKKGSTGSASAMQTKEHVSSASSESNRKKTITGSIHEQRLVAPKTEAEKFGGPFQQVENEQETASTSSIQNVDKEQVEAQESRKPRKIENKRRIVGSPTAPAQQKKQQTPVLQLLKQKRSERINKNAKEVTTTTRPMKLDKHVQGKDASTSPSSDHARDERRRPRETERNAAANSNIHFILSKCSTAENLQEISISEDRALKVHFNAIESRVTGSAHDDTIDSLREQPRQSSMPEIQEGSLNEHENQLKQKLIKSQHFLNAAEAIFKLQIPVGILHASHNKHQDEENKLLLNTAYEIMRRKAERAEQGFHPAVGMHIVSMNVNGLDDLVKELHKDLEHLDFYGKTAGGEYDAAACMFKLLEGDIQNRKPEANCMWDFGWNNMTFAYLEKDEVIKDVEKHVLNKLIDEFTREILHASTEKNYYGTISQCG